MLKKLYKYIAEKIFKIYPCFKIRKEKTFFASSYSTIKFSNNNGWSYDYLLGIDYNVDSAWGKVSVGVKLYHDDEIDDVISSFKSYEDCVRHNEIIRETVDDENKVNYQNYLNQK